ncbi:hypothetical protein CARUB_v10005812mg [Capsella rubella]|uniref:Uncharacterized protein n=1 Tax=Capsella rubella TaxID=81985 RepID=R0GKV6_9BRAS|nr:uncharacterized protein LOC17878294 [Capsella rubella]EOA17484.1 hypothetical protein CARUB_v10005812mg [Capsella rubella]
MAEKKPWAHLDDAINDFWKSFSGATDDTNLSLFSKDYTDERIPESFLEKFRVKLVEAKWTLSEDPGCKIPKDLMDEVFQATKKKMMRKVSKQNKKKLAEAEKKGEIAENEEIAEKEEVVSTLTEEEMKKNLDSMLQKNEEREKTKMIKRGEKAVKNSGKTMEKKMASQELSMKHQLRGYDKLIWKSWWD